ncbi:MAG: hypothetical protein FJY91_00425 [Candidatus Harrisonbacteria bacterium]|nr:hypothetical protein [Candidatus Harrisonbacteria bacterium]
MIRLLGTVLIHFLLLLVLMRWLSGFFLTGRLWEIGLLAVLFTFINRGLRPIMTMLLTPFYYLTFGILGVAINGGVFLILDFYSKNITISSYQSLLYAALALGATNLVLEILP